MAPFTVITGLSPRVPSKSMLTDTVDATFVHDENEVERFVDEMTWWMNNTHEELVRRLAVADEINKEYHDEGK